MMEDTRDESQIALIFGSRFREERRRKGLTQADAGKQIKVSRNLISAWERGRLMPGPKYWVRIINCLEVSFDYLTAVTDVRTDGRFSVLSEEEQLKLNKKGRKQLRTYYDFLIRTLEYRD